MALDELPNGFVLPSRGQIRDRWCRDYQLRAPDAEVGPNTMPYLDGSTFADQATPLYNDGRLAAERYLVRGTFGESLQKLRVEEGLPERPATGAIGHVTITTAASGANILLNAELKHEATNQKFRCLVGKVYTSAEPVPIQGIDTGPGTNLAPGTKLVWMSPFPGLAAACTVFEQSDGSGLSGGLDAETDPELQERIIAKRSNPEASGNEAEVIAEVERTPGLSIQKAFVIPAIRGTGTKAVMFTMKPSSPGGSRIPNGAALGQVEANLKSAFPGDDGYFVCMLVAQVVALGFKVTWSSAGAGFADNDPWPAYASSPVKVDNAVAITASAFRATTSVNTNSPVVGQTIGLFNTATKKFVQKRISSVSVIVAQRSWDLTFDMANAASDSYIPADDALISPWSDSLNDIPPSVLTHIDVRGPGEQLAVLADPGRRGRRVPESPAFWPSTITNRITEPLFRIASVHDIELAFPAVPYVTSVGTPGVSSNLIQFGDLAVYEQ